MTSNITTLTPDQLSKMKKAQKEFDDKIVEITGFSLDIVTILHKQHADDACEGCGVLSNCSPPHANGLIIKTAISISVTGVETVSEDDDRATHPTPPTTQ